MSDGVLGVLKCDDDDGGGGDGDDMKGGCLVSILFPFCHFPAGPGSAEVV